MPCLLADRIWGWQRAYGQAIAVDNEGDVFVNGYGSTFMGVVEYKAHSQGCTKPNVEAEQGYVAGVRD
jgi:hypothetical protein